MFASQRYTGEIADGNSRFVSNKQGPAIEAFLGIENRNLLHKLIIRNVYDKTNGKAKIGQQSDDELQIMMIRTLQEKHDHLRSVQELNQLTIRTATENIIKNIGFYIRYVEDTNNDTRSSSATMDLLVPQSTRDSRETPNRAVF